MNQSNDRPDGRGPLLSHLQDLFVSLKFFLLFLGLGGGVGYWISTPVLEWITQPYQQVMGDASKLIYLSPFEKVWVHLRISFWTGILIAAPALFWSIFRFVSPALQRAQKRILLKMSFVIWVMICVGVYFAQKYSVPLLLKALTGFKGFNEAPFIALSPYVDMALGAILATTLLFQLPIFMFFLSRLGFVSKQDWSSSRRMALVLNAIVSAVLSPPDVLSMFVLMVPIQILYEVGVLLSGLGQYFRSVENSSKP